MDVYRQTSVDELGLFVDADDYYREFYRAASQAKKSIVMSGWQFDSEVSLLRGPDAQAATAPVTLLKFLDHLCRQTPSLQIWVLAWDFHLVFAAEREWMQDLVFHWSTSDRLHFLFDASHVEGGSHHQKFVVVDGELSFVGGLDLCEDRWDDRQHRATNPLRLSRGKPHKPFHDIQAFARGDQFASAVTELFAARWVKAGGEPIDPGALASGQALASHVVKGLLPLAARTVALNRTDPHGTPGGATPTLEILKQYERAIDAAESLVYVETQYFSSHAIAEAVQRRMRASGRGPVEWVFILNMRGETLKEQAAVGLAQAQVIGRLREVAAETGHPLGIYFTMPSCETGETPALATYVHAKLMMVDDRWLTVGSANLTNRSMGVDTELNVTVAAQRDDDPLARSIRRARQVLLAEHTGGDELSLTAGLVAKLDEMVAAGEPCRLRRHPSPTEGEKTALSLIDPAMLPFDPDHVEALDHEQKSDFLSGLRKSVKELFGDG